MARAAALLSLLLCAAAHAGGTHPARRLSWVAEDDDRLPGWKGELRRPEVSHGRAATKGQQYSREDRERGTWVELLSWRPRAYLIHNFMSPEECVQAVKIARPFMQRSTVVDSVTGESKVDPIRTRRDFTAPAQPATLTRPRSEQTFLGRGQYELITTLEVCARGGCEARVGALLR